MREALGMVYCDSMRLNYASKGPLKAQTKWISPQTKAKGLSSTAITERFAWKAMA